MNIHSKTKPVSGVCNEHGQWQRDWPVSFQVLPECPQCALRRRAAEDAELERQRQADCEDIATRSAIAAIGLHKRFVSATLASFRVSCEDQAAAVRACAAFIDDFTPTSGHNLLLLGPVGTGKTHLAAAIGRAVAERGKGATTVAATTVAAFLRELYATWGRDSRVDEGAVLRHYGSADLLVVDELGVGGTGERERDRLFQLVDYRYQAMKPTIYISNLGGAALRAAIGERSFDRIQHGAVALACDWQSFRRLGAPSV